MIGLDMCAAPGSKTSQLLEIVNRSIHHMFSTSVTTTSSSSVTATATAETYERNHGLVVANDCDTDRAYMLVHQCKRINSPLLVITTHPGQAFPTLINQGT